MHAFLLYVQLSVSTTRVYAGSLEPPSLSPMRDTLIPISSSENVTYTCETDEQLTIIWQLNGQQIQGSMARATYRNILLTPAEYCMYSSTLCTDV